ncbi:TraB/GumN family protein [Flavobacterium celericrescens]|uniref:TraB/GumN family protein n=1 Tax=Flavobacterium celericrescens TaxID=2709780 RepID=A0ABX0IJ75_9FLAO|nr:TraB/GumN family protein [Flavobacterium celericrescens]NHM05326.1 TraB/GumN family protein [Flavobacterium celericrescens]
MKYLLLVAGLLTSLYGNSQELEKSLLWKISGNGLQEPSYIFGTIHATCDASLDENTIKALQETKQLYLELDMDDKAMQMQMLKYMKMNNDVKLSTLLSAEDFKIVDEFLKKHMNMSAKMFDTFKPFVVSSMLLPKMLDCKFQSVESELIKVTEKQGEEIYGLEDIKDQMKVFDAIPYQVQADELLKTAKSDLKQDKEEFIKLLEIYKDKDIEGMLKAMDESENKISSENQDLLLNNRNKNWIPIISETASKIPTFFGVGAGHLAGEEGVIKLLRKEGFIVEPVQ